MAMFKLFKKSQKHAARKSKPAPIRHSAPKPARKQAKPQIKREKPAAIKKAEFKKMPDEKAYELLKRYKIQVPEYAFCKSEEELDLALKRIGFPCVMKVSGSIIHKTNVSGVRLNIATKEDALKAFSDLIKIKGTNTVLIQKMITEGYELIVGGKKDPQFNKIVALGAGGVLTEVMKDVSFRIAPLSKTDAEEMLNEVKFSELILKGFRGQRPADANSIIEVILAVSRIMESNPEIKELDINPLFASHDKAIAADVRIILE